MGQLDKVVDHTGRETKFRHELDGDVKEIIDPDNTSRKFAYDSHHRMISQTSKRGFDTAYEYDYTGRLFQTTLPGLPSAIRRTTSSESMAVVDPTTGLGSGSTPAPVFQPGEIAATFRDAEMRLTTFETGRYGRPTKVTGPDLLETTVTRDADGNATKTEVATGRDMDRTFDAAGNVLTITDAALGTAGGTTTFTYDPTFNLVTEIKDDRGFATTVVRFASGNVDHIDSELGRVTSFTYDDPAIPTPDGLVHTMTDTLGRETTFVYDGDRNLTQIRRGIDLPAGQERVTTFSPTPEGYIDTITNAEMEVTNLDYDALGRVKRLTFPDLRFVTLDYDDNGNLESLTPPSTPMHVFNYDERERESDYFPPALPTVAVEETTFAYNGESEVELIIRPDNTKIDPLYEASGRLDTITLDLNPGTAVYDHTYDPGPTGNGLLTSIDAPDGTRVAFDYTLGLLDQITWSVTISGDVGFAFDGDGRVTDEWLNGIQLVADPTDDFRYDNDGLLIQAGAIELDRDDPTTGLLSDTTLGSVTTILAYNDFGELESDATSFAATPLYSVNYSLRDKLGRIRAKSETIQGVTTLYEYTYDTAGRLDVVKEGATLPVVVRDYGYDQNGNRTDVREDLLLPPIAGYDDQDRLESYDGTVYAYSDAGDLESKTEGSDVTNYTYDPLGNLVHVQLPDGSEIEYLIDGANRRVGKKVGVGTPVLVQGFLYRDALNPVAELDAASQLVSRFVYGSKANVPDYMERDGGTFRLLSDQQGSVRLVVDTSSGVVRQRTDYDEFGTIIQRLEYDASGVLAAPLLPFQPFGFAGGLYDPDTELVRFGARDYDPRVGRWTSKDPIRFDSSGTNLYAYALNDPVNLLDLSGLSPFVNSSPGRVVVRGTVRNPDGSKGGFESVTTEPGRRIDINNPFPVGGGRVLTDVDSVDFNGDGVAETPRSVLDTYPFGEKILGGSAGPVCEVTANPDGPGVVPGVGGFVPPNNISDLVD